ncbi:putative UPF0481 protein At3g02645 [Humulus lupulus]|uniref:putative UPF0481 protein At3g02645 n=1 Tax=Humulus lupulus TaxID=3486 RepID=UPI002B418401|nr:putative UPF0481 protein At3g02645 [Humulus lupulus]
MSRRGKNLVQHITEIFEKDDLDIPITIFKVPKSLTQANPEVYVPKLMGLGAMHHLRPRLKHMQMYKVMEAKKIHKGFQGIAFSELIEILKEIVVSSVRASYNIYLEIEDDILTCIMAVDGLFLFDLLCCYGIEKQHLLSSNILSQMVDSTGRRLAQETTLREAMMLENQIPILVLRTILIIESPEFEIVSEYLPKILVGFCQYVSPFDIMIDYPPYKTLNHAHLLDLLYHLIIPEDNFQEENDLNDLLRGLFDNVKSKIQALKAPKQETRKRIRRTKIMTFEAALDVSLNLAPIQYKKTIELAKGLFSLPWSELGSSVSSAVKGAIVEEETLIPTASELHKAGVKFVPGAQIRSIKFDSKSVSLHLPSMKLGGNSDVIIKNLVAYEALIKSETEELVLAPYAEIMSDLIRTSDDVMVLKNDGIIKLDQSIDERQVIKVFSRMNKSVQSTNTSESIDKQIETVKSYYNGLWKVSARRFINKGWLVAGNWCKVLAAVLLLVLMGIQAFCSVYECHRLSFKTNNSSQSLQGLRVLSLRSDV